MVKAGRGLPFETQRRVRCGSRSEMRLTCSSRCTAGMAGTPGCSIFSYASTLSLSLSLTYGADLIMSYPADTACVRIE